MSQEELCDGICTQETLSRIESGKQKPSNRNLKRLLERMNRSGNRVGTVITADEYRTIELKRQYEMYVYKLEMSKAKEILMQLERLADISEKETWKYICAEKIRAECQGGTLTYEAGIEKLWEILKREMGCVEALLGICLSSTDVKIFNQISIYYYMSGRTKKAIELHRSVLENYEKSSVMPIFHIREWTLQVGNLSMYLEEENELDEAEKLARREIEFLLEANRTGEVGRAISEIGCVLEKRNNKEFLKYLKQSVGILHLVKLERRYKEIEEYVDRMEGNVKTL